MLNMSITSQYNLSTHDITSLLGLASVVKELNNEDAAICDPSRAGSSLSLPLLYRVWMDHARAIDGILHYISVMYNIKIP
jgi:hypothetical protein